MAASDRRAGAVREHTPTVSWFELFYDLVVVAAVSLCNDSLLEHPSTTMAVTAVLGIAALSWAWFMTTLINNVFPGQDLLRRFLVLAQMGAIILAALAVDQTEGISNSTGLAAFGISLGLAALLILWCGRGAARRDLWRIAGPLLIAMCVGLVGSALPTNAVWPFVVAALAISMAPVLTSEFHRWQARSMLRVDHLRERLGLFVIIILGEGFAQMVHALHSLGTVPRVGVFALTFLLSFALWWIYFDGTFSQRTDLARVRWRLSLLAHFTLVLGMLGTLDILVLLTVQPENVLDDITLGYFVVSLALVLLSYATLGFTAHGRLGVAGWTQVISALAVVAAGLVAPTDDAAPLILVISASALVLVANAIVSVWADQADATVGWRRSLKPLLSGADPDADPHRPG